MSSIFGCACTCRILYHKSYLASLRSPPRRRMDSDEDTVSRLWLWLLGGAQELKSFLLDKTVHSYRMERERERGTLFPHCSFMLLPPGRRLQSSCSILRYLTAQDTGPLCAMCVCLFAVVVRTFLCRWPHPAAQALVCQVSTVHCMVYWVYWCSSARSVWRMFRTPLRRLVWICLSHFLTTANVVAILKYSVSLLHCANRKTIGKSSLFREHGWSA